MVVVDGINFFTREGFSLREKNKNFPNVAKTDYQVPVQVVYGAIEFLGFTIFTRATGKKGQEGDHHSIFITIYRFQLQEL